MVELGLSPDLRRDDTASATIAAAAAAGFESIGLGAQQCDSDAVDALAAAGVACREVMALLVRSPPDTVVAAAEAIVPALDAVGADWLPVVFFARPTSEVLAALGSAADVVGDAGVRLAIESSPLAPVATIDDGLAVVDALGADRSALLLDSWHFGHGGGTWADLATVPLDRLAYVQFADARPPVSDDLMAETIDRRALPGRGELDLGRFATTLLERGFDGLVMAEVLSIEQRALPVAAAARAAFAATGRYWR